MKRLTAGIASLFAFGSVVAGTLEPIPYSTAMQATGTSGALTVLGGGMRFILR